MVPDVVPGSADGGRDRLRERAVAACVSELARLTAELTKRKSNPNRVIRAKLVPATEEKIRAKRAELRGLGPGAQVEF